MDYKSLTKAELDEIFGSVSFRTTPGLHQLQSLAWAADKRRIAYWGDVGIGKSLWALYALKMWGCSKTLIVCPNSVVKGWAEQIEEHTDTTFHILTGTAAKRKKLLAKPGDLYVINYEGLSVLFSEKVEKLDPRSGEYYKIWQIDHKAIRKAGFDSLLVDECHHVKNKDANQTKIVHAIAKDVRNMIMMTGTPVSTTEADLWAQYWCLDDGLTFGSKSYMKFLKHHFKQRAYGWAVTVKGKKEILGQVAPVTMRFGREECGELPPLIEVDRVVQMTPEQKKLTKDICEGVLAKVGDGVLSPQDELQVPSKLAQVAGGFLIGDDGKVTRLKKNPKLDAAMEIVEDTGEKVIIFHQYVEEGRMLHERLEKAGIDHAQLRGEVKDKDSQYWRFKHDARCRVLVAHPASGGEGLNLQVASVVWFYSSDYSGAVTRPQCVGRVWRAGQEKTCVVGDIILSGSIDEVKLDRISSRKQMAKAVLEWVKTYKG